MPISRITFNQSRYTPQRIAQVSDILHQTLIDTFDVPPADRFQVLEPKQAGELIYDLAYLAKGRTADYLLVSILGGKPRSREQKAHFYRLLTERLGETLAIGASDIMVTVQFNQLDDWCFGEGKIASA